MATSLSITVKDEGVKALLKEVEAKLGHMLPAMKEIGETEISSVRLNFERGGRPNKWEALSDVTTLRREKLGKWPGQTLLRSGALSRVHYEAFNDRVAIGSPMIYAAVMHEGAEKGSFGTFTERVKEHQRKGKTVKSHTRRVSLPWGDIPARPFLLVQDEDWERMKETIKKHVLGR